MSGEIRVNYEELTNIIRSTQEAFFISGKYTLTRREANEQFGSSTIDILIKNNLLKDARICKAERVKCRFLLSDIITAVAIFEKTGQ